MADLKDIEKYFLDRAQELCDLAEVNKGVWPFLCTSTFIEYLAKMVNSNTNLKDWKIYGNFILDYFPAKYKNFHFANSYSVRDLNGSGRINTKQCLPQKMYDILRNGLVHSFSLIDSNNRISRTVVLCHRDANAKHLNKYKKNAKGFDSVVFVAEDFAKDVLSVTKKIFRLAKKDTALENRIKNYYGQKPPVCSII